MRCDRPVPDDVPAVAAVITARSAWMEQQGLASWRQAVDDLAGQAAVDGTLMWVLTADEQVIGCTTLADDRPVWGWTPEQAAQDSFYLFTTCTHPGLAACQAGLADRLVGRGQGRGEGKQFVRRGTVEVESRCGTTPRKASSWSMRCSGRTTLVYLMARRAQRLPELERMFAAGSAVLVS